MDLLDPMEKLDLWREMQELVLCRKKRRSRHLAGMVGLFFCMGVTLLVLGACYQSGAVNESQVTRVESRYSDGTPGIQKDRGGDETPLVIHL